MAEFDAVIVGGGAAGLFAAAMIGRNGGSTLIVERNRQTGKKLLITGKGRCNVTNHCQPDEVLKNIPTNPKFLYSAVMGFPPAAVMDYFEQLGVALKTERGNRVFPVSDKAQDIAAALEHDAKAHGTRIVRGRAAEILMENGKAIGVKTAEDSYFAKNVLIATGGISYPITGSTGDGYTLAKQAGHSIIKPAPSLVPLVLSGSEAARMMGLSLRNVTLSAYEENRTKPVFSEQGELLFTHYGVSGPLVLSASAHLRPDEGRHYALSIDLKPALTEKQLDLRVQRDFADFANRDFCNALEKLLPAKLIPVAVERSKIGAETKVHSITKEQRQAFVRLLKDFRFAVKGFRPAEEAVITRGGVCVKEINPKTLESKLVSHLFFAGEVLDCDAYTGGFNLQIAFSTAYAAATAICQKQTERN